MTHKRNLLLTAGLALALTLTACGGSDASQTDGELSGETFTVGSKEFTESHVLAHIAMAALEDAGATTKDQTGISGSATVREALETGEIDMYWDYTGTGWVNILGNTTEDVPENLYEAVAQADAANGIAWLTPANFENTYRLATSAAFAEEHGLVTTSDAAEFMGANPEHASICAAAEFINRDDGLPGVEAAYGMSFSEIVELDLNLIYTQVGDSCEFGEVFSTDARIVSNDLYVLEDDADFFVEYAGALTLRQETLEQFPELAEIFDPISAALTNEVMTELNGQVDNDGIDPDQVAAEWLTENGFIG